jgi:hypothetical protein
LGKELSREVLKLIHLVMFNTIKKFFLLLIFLLHFKKIGPTHDKARANILVRTLKCLKTMENIKILLKLLNCWIRSVIFLWEVFGLSFSFLTRFNPRIHKMFIISFKKSLLTFKKSFQWKKFNFLICKLISIPVKCN